GLHLGERLAHGLAAGGLAADAVREADHRAEEGAHGEGPVGHPPGPDVADREEGEDEVDDPGDDPQQDEVDEPGEDARAEVGRLPDLGVGRCLRRVRRLLPVGGLLAVRGLLGIGRLLTTRGRGRSLVATGRRRLRRSRGLVGLARGRATGVLLSHVIPFVWRFRVMLVKIRRERAWSARDGPARPRRVEVSVQRATSAVATASSPSPRPVKPSPSVVVAARLTGAPSARLIAAAASSRRGPMRGRLPMTWTATLPMVKPDSRTSSAVAARNCAPEAPAHRGSAVPNREPRSPRPAAESSASHAACAATSPSEWPSRPTSPGHWRQARKRGRSLS